ncbi:MAG TPA: SIMPL domain-containing protein, partial [Flexilinea sp.]|nr:SIMPL domain-containing protein [Flexilinea sp.]
LFIGTIALFGISVFKVSAQSESPAIIKVKGTGEVTLNPDLALIDIAIATTADDSKTAIDENRKNALAIQQGLLEMGLKEDDIRTTEYILYSLSKTDKDGNPIAGQYIYKVNLAYEIVVRDLSMLNDVLNFCIQNGANNLYGINFDYSKRSEALAQARELAIDHANANAQQIAEKFGKKIDHLQTFSVVDNAMIPLVPTKLVKDVSTPPIDSGFMTITVSVDMEFALTD